MLSLRFPVDFLTLVLLEKGHRGAVDAWRKWFFLLDGTHDDLCDAASRIGHRVFLEAPFDACVVLREELCIYNHYLSEQDAS